MIRIRSRVIKSPCIVKYVDNGTNTTNALGILTSLLSAYQRWAYKTALCLVHRSLMNASSVAMDTNRTAKQRIFQANLNASVFLSNVVKPLHRNTLAFMYLLETSLFPTEQQVRIVVIQTSFYKHTPTNEIQLQNEH